MRDCGGKKIEPGYNNSTCDCADISDALKTASFFFFFLTDGVLGFYVGKGHKA